jgi:CHAT domain-containing protein
VDAIRRDDLDAFDPLVASTGFNWKASLAPLVFRYQCPSVEQWSFNILERRAGFARVRLAIDGTALVAGRGTLTALPRYWILHLAESHGRWVVQSFAPLERDLARRIMRARPEERSALFASDPDADPHRLIREIGDCAVEEVGEIKESLDRVGETVPDAARTLAAFARDQARRLLHSTTDEAIASSLLAAALRLYGRRTEALPIAEESVDLAYRSGDPDALAAAHLSRGLGRWVNGDTDGAREDLSVAGRLVDDVDDVIVPLHSRVMLAYVSVTEHAYRETILRTEELLAVSRRVGWTEGLADGTWQLADIHYSLRDFGVARELYVRAGSLSRKAHAEFAGAEVFDIVRCDLALGDTARVKREIKSLRTGDTAPAAVTTLADALIAANRLGEAERVLGRMLATAEEADNSRGISDAFTTLAWLRLAQRRPRAALEAAHEALRYGLDGKAPLVEWSAWRAEAVTARALRALGRQHEARATLEEGINLVEQLRTSVVSDPSASRYFEDKGDLYDDLMETDLALGDLHGALEAAERLRARTLRDALSQANLDRDATLTPAEKSREAAAERQLEAANRKSLAAGTAPSATLRAERDQARLALDQVADELMAVHPELRARRVDFRPALSLPPSLDSTAVVEYAVTANATYIFTIVRHNGATTIAVKRARITRRALGQLVRQLNLQLAHRDLLYRRTAGRLYDLLIAPVAETIFSRRELCIVPDGDLWRLPFQVLTDGGGADLVSRRAVFYSPAFTLLTAGTMTTSTPAANRRMLVAFANPKQEGPAVAQMRALFRGARLGALPDAETEVRRIAEIYGRSRSDVFVGSEARESTFKRTAKSARIVHVATHGVIDDRAPLYSALLFAAGGGGDDGLLEAREVLDLHLDADLVVLSACDSAGGKIGAGEGVVGLSWAFLVAGCQTLVVAQSPAESRATSRLMVEFHRQLSSGLSPAESLRRAQLALRKDPRFAHPFYWAPFVVIGHGLKPLSR